MPEMVIVPYERCGPVRFDATEEEVVEVLGPPDTAFAHRHVEGQQLNYRTLGLHVHFDGSGRCRSVEADRTHVPIVDGGLRLTGAFEDLVWTLRQRGFTVRLGPEPGEAYEASCDALGDILWRESEDEEDVESVRAVRSGESLYPAGEGDAPAVHPRA